MYQKKYCRKKHVDSWLIWEEVQRHWALIKDFNTFMYDHTLNSGRKHFCNYYFWAFSKQEILKSQNKDCFKINNKPRVLMPKKVEYVKFKN